MVYSEKGEVKLAWEDLQRRITVQLDLELRKFRAKQLDKLLPEARAVFERQVAAGEIPEIVNTHTEWVQAALAEAVIVELPKPPEPDPEPDPEPPASEPVHLATGFMNRVRQARAA